MAQDRLKRVLILLVIVGFLLVGGKVFADWQNKKRASGQPISLPLKDISAQINNLGEEVLGNAISIIPGSSDLREKILEKPTPTVVKESSSSSGQQGSQTVVTKETVSNTEVIIQMLKDLPADQLDKIKKQVFKDFCQQILAE